MSSSKILFLAANPTSTGRLALDEEVRDIEAKLRASEYRDSLTMRTRWAVRYDDVLQALNEDRPTVVHFSGHGAGESGIIFHDEMDGSKLVPARTLRRLFSTLKDDIQVVILNACYTAEQANAIADIIDCVIGMKHSIADTTARKFSASFYRALGFGRSVKNAFEQGLLAIEGEFSSDEDIPILHIRQGVSADEVFAVGSQVKQNVNIRTGRTHWSQNGPKA